MYMNYEINLNLVAQEITNNTTVAHVTYRLKMMFEHYQNPNSDTFRPCTPAAAPTTLLKSVSSVNTRLPHHTETEQNSKRARSKLENTS